MSDQPIELVALHLDMVVTTQLVCLVDTCHEVIVPVDAERTTWHLFTPIFASSTDSGGRRRWSIGGKDVHQTLVTPGGHYQVVPLPVPELPPPL